MDGIKFGMAGSSEAFYESGNKNSEQMPKYMHDLGLSAFEYSFGKGVRMGTEKATSIKNSNEPYGISYSVHAPYFINFANEDREKIENSFRYVLEAGEKCRELGGKRIVFHPASCGKAKREDAFERAKKNINELGRVIIENKLDDMIFCPETMGKTMQIGITHEVIEFCRDYEFFIPCIDFGHLNSYTQGGLKTKDDFKAELEKIFNGIGEERAKKIHVHFSKIQYGSKGEIRHLTFEDDKFGPEFGPLGELFYDYKMSPTIICESAGTQDIDAVSMKDMYNDYALKNN